jgi:hypothetical protein
MGTNSTKHLLGDKSPHLELQPVIEKRAFNQKENVYTYDFLKNDFC